MEFITEEVQKTLGLTPEQVKGIEPLYNDHIANQKKDWDGKANENAEKIIEGAAKTIMEATGVAREQGEKVAEYLKRAGGLHISTLKSEVELAKAEYDKKIADFKGDSATKEELQKAKDELDRAKQQLAEFDTYKEKAEKYEPLENEYKTMKLQIAFQSVKPTFPDTVNPYEAKAKWDDFVKDVQEKWTIELVDGEAVCKDKENNYKVAKLKDLVQSNEAITALLAGRKQDGMHSKEKELQKIDGVPFEVPKGADSQERSKAISEYLLKQGVVKTSPEYAKQFAELYKKILAKA
jgi:hypothetical protein